MSSELALKRLETSDTQPVDSGYSFPQELPKGNQSDIQ